MEPSMQLVTLGTRLPSFVTSLAATIVKLLLKDEIFGELMSSLAVVEVLY